MDLSEKPSPPLDAFLEPAEAAAWLGITLRTLQQKSKGRKPRIPAFRIGRKVIRYHVRTVITKLAEDAGIDREMLAMSFSRMSQTEKPF